MNDIDKRVVQMEFDNSKFEKNCKQTMKTLDQLDKQLAFEGASSGLDKVSLKFKAMEVAAIAAIGTITNKVINLGVQLVKTLSVDNIATGWNKFNAKTIAVGTMLSQKIKIAGKELTNANEKMEAINEQLEKLLWFTDETSYNFTAMVDSISKFTATGQNLDDSVNAVMGIALWAATAGKNASEASRAMAELAQVGEYIKMQDWMSIQNLTMDTDEFRQAVLDTAVAMGELTKQGENYITKTGKKFTKSTFTKYFSEGWFKKSVLSGALGKYSASIEEIYLKSQEMNMTVSAYLARYGDTLDQFSVKAIRAAQEARTFSDVLGSIKDAVSTGWMTTIERFIGGYTESVKTWSEMADAMYDMFVESGNFRNAILDVWQEIGGRKTLIGKHGDSNQGIFWNLYDAVDALQGLVRSTFNDIFGLSAFENETEQAEDLGNQFYVLTSAIQEYTKSIRESLVDNENLNNILKGVFSVLKTGASIIYAIVAATQPLRVLIKELISDGIGQLSAFTSKLADSEHVIEGIFKITRSITNALYDLISYVKPQELLNNVFIYLNKIVDSLDDLGIFETIQNSIENFFKSIKENSNNGQNFLDFFDAINALIKTLFKTLSIVVDFVARNFAPMVNKIIGLTTKVASALVSMSTYILSVIGNILSEFDNMLNGNYKFGNIINRITDFVESIVDAIKNLNKTTASSGVGKRSKAKAEDNDAFAPILTFLEGLYKFVISALKLLGPILNLVGTVFSLLSRLLDYIGKELKDFSKFLEEITSDRAKELGKSVGNTLAFVAILGLVAYAIYALYYAIAATVNPIGRLTEAVTDYLDAKRVYRTFDGLAELLFALGASMLMISGAFALFKNIDQTSIDKAWQVMAPMISFVTLLTLIAGDLGNTVEQMFTTKLGNQSTIAAEQTTTNVARDLDAISRLMMALSTGLLGMAVAMRIMGNIPLDKFDVINTAMLTYAGIIAAVSLISKYSNVKGTDVWQMVTIGVALVTFAGAIRLLAGAELEKINAAVTALKTILLTIAGLVILIGNVGGNTNDIAKLSFLSFIVVTIAGSLALLVNTCETVDLAIATAILIGILAIFGIMVRVMSGADFSKISIKKLSGITMMVGAIVTLMLAFAGSMMMLSKASKDIEDKSEDAGESTEKALKPIERLAIVMGSALALMGVLTAGLVALTMLPGLDTMKILSVGAVMVSLGLSMIAFAGALQMIAAVDFENIAGGIGIVIPLIITLAAVAALLSKIGGDKVLLEVAAAMAAIGIAGLGLGAGIMLAAMGFEKFVQVMVDNKDQLPEIFKSLVDVVVYGFQQFLTLLDDVFRTLISFVNESLIFLINDVNRVLIATTPSTVATLVVLIASLIGALSDNWDVIWGGICNIFDKIVKYLKEYLPTIVENLIDLVGELLIVLTEKLPKLEPKVKDFLKMLITQITKLIVELIPTIVDNLLLLVRKITTYVLQKVVPFAAELLRILLVVTAAALELFIVSVGSLTDLIVQAIGALIITTTNAIFGLMGVIKEALKSILYNIFNIFCAIMEDLPKTGLGLLKKSLGSLLKGIMLVLADIIRGLGKNNALGPLTNMLADAMEGAADKVSDALAPDDWEEVLSGENVKKAMEQASNSIHNGITMGLDSIENSLSRATHDINTMIDNFLENLENSDNGSVGIGSKLGGMIQSLFSWTDEQFSQGAGVVTDWLDGLFGKVDDKLDEVSDEVHDKAGGIADNIFSGLGEALGEDAAADALDGPIRGVGRFLIDTSKDELGIHSPSTEFIEIGKYVDEGFAEGIKNNAYTIFDAISDVIAGIKQILDENIDDGTLVIRPVLDLSNVQNGARSLSSLMGGINGYSLSGQLASTASSEISQSRMNKIRNSQSSNSTGSVVTNEGDTYYNTFNVTTNNPEELARETDRLLQLERIKANMAKGGVK